MIGGHERLGGAATASIGTGQRRTTTSATAPNSPAWIWCSSAVTIAPQSRAAAQMVSSSMGLIVCRSTTRRETPSRASSSAARVASWTMAPQAKTAQSDPSRTGRALPMVKGVSSSVTTGTASRPNRK